PSSSHEPSGLKSLPRERGFGLCGRGFSPELFARTIGTKVPPTRHRLPAATMLATLQPLLLWEGLQPRALRANHRDRSPSHKTPTSSLDHAGRAAAPAVVGGASAPSSSPDRSGLKSLPQETNLQPRPCWPRCSPCCCGRGFSPELLARSIGTEVPPTRHQLAASTM